MSDPQSASANAGAEVTSKNLIPTTQFDDIPIRASKQDFNLDTQISPKKDADINKLSSIAMSGNEDARNEPMISVAPVEIQLEAHLVILLGLLNSYVSDFFNFQLS